MQIRETAGRRRMTGKNTEAYCGRMDGNGMGRNGRCGMLRHTKTVKGLLSLCAVLLAAALMCYLVSPVPALAAGEAGEIYDIVEEEENDDGAADSQQTIPSQRQRPLLVDEADLLDEFEEGRLLDELTEVSTKEQMDVAVVTVNGLDGKSAEAYADDFYDYNGYGQGADRDGVLLLISMADRDWHVTTTGFGIRAVNDAGVRLIEERIVSDLSSGNYYYAFHRYCSTVEELADQARDGSPYSEERSSGTVSMQSRVIGSAAGAIILGFIIGMIFTGRQKAKLKSVRRQRGAGAYIYGEASHLDISEDRFITRNVSRTRIQRDDDRGGGSTIHTGSSGTSHGGGGGKF